MKFVAERWMREIWKDRNFDSFDEIHAVDFQDFSSGKRASDRESYRQSIVELFEAFPDWEAEIEDLVLDETSNKVAVRWTAFGTHQKDFLGFSATNQRIHFCGIEIIRVENSQITERWGEWDGLSLAEQLQNKKPEKIS